MTKVSPLLVTSCRETAGSFQEIMRRCYEMITTTWVWEIIKIAVLPLCIWFLQRKITQRDDKREAEYENQKRVLDEQTKRNNDVQYLLMQRVDKVSEMTHLMAVKLHEKRIINGDLEALDKKYKELDEEYDEEVKRLALMFSKRG